MIEINLLPRKLNKGLGGLSLLSIGNVPVKELVRKVSVAALAILLAGIAMYTALGVLLMRLEAKQKKFAPQLARIQEIRSQSLNINEDIQTLDNIFQRRIFWSKFLNDLSDSIIPEIWLGEFYAGNVAQGQGIFADDPETLKIRGYAISISEEGPALVGKLIKSLKDNPGTSRFFNNARLADIQKKQIKDIGIVDFVIECGLREQKEAKQQKEAKK